MNPIAILAFLTGIGTGYPPTTKPAEKEDAQQQEKPAPTDKDKGHAKRGGWDYN